MIVTINDANILIDLLNVKLFELFLLLPFEFNITNFICDEIMRAEQKEQITKAHTSKRINIIILDAKDIEQAAALKMHYNFSIQDGSCLHISKKINAVLLTGDKVLRDAAANEKVNVHGIIWILDQMLEHNVLDPLKAAMKLEELTSINSRLPERLCKERIKLWREIK